MAPHDSSRRPFLRKEGRANAGGGGGGGGGPNFPFLPVIRRSSFFRLFNASSLKGKGRQGRNGAGAPKERNGVRSLLSALFLLIA